MPSISTWKKRTIGRRRWHIWIDSRSKLLLGTLGTAEVDFPRMDPKAWREGRDPQLEKAIAIVKDETGQSGLFCAANGGIIFIRGLDPIKLSRGMSMPKPRGGTSYRLSEEAQALLTRLSGIRGFSMTG